MRRRDSGEYAVIGLGGFGASVARTLVNQGNTVLGIDENTAIVRHLADHLTQTVAMDATDEAALREIDIATFDTVIVAIGQEFEDSVLVTVALKELGVRRVVAKALTERQRTVLLRVGADRVVLPEQEAGQRLALELSEPGLLDLIAVGAHHQIVELPVPRSLVGQTLEAANLRRFDATVLAVKRGEAMHVSPAADTVLGVDDVLIVLGTKAAVTRLCDLP